MTDKFYITTAIAYTNGPPHIGHALEFLQADVIARYHRLAGDDTWFLTGTDEHGATVVKAAEKANQDVKVFVDEVAGKFKELTKVYNISNDDFIRTSDQMRHWPVAQKMWRALTEKGDLYKKNYQGLYCVGHEAFIKKSDLVSSLCPLHKIEPEKIEEENWFFKLTRYKKEVKKRIKSGKLSIVPESRIQEVLNLIDDAEDVSFSRPISSLRWGIPVPNDSTQTMYVWADALVNYISALGYGQSIRQAQDRPKSLFERFWPADIHLVGKDILRFHAMIWPAMLLSVGLELPKAIYVHGFINIAGEKMSKTIGNVINPFQLVEKYGTDPVRYFLLREIPSDEDGDFSYKKLEERYNGDLANGLGNLVQRVATLIENNMDGELIYKSDKFYDRVKNYIDNGLSDYEKNIAVFRLHEALGNIWDIIGFANAYVDDKKPWVEARENPSEFLKTITTLVVMIHYISWLLQPFMPETADKITQIFGDNLSNKEPLNNYKFLVKKTTGLFPRLN